MPSDYNHPSNEYCADNHSLVQISTCSSLKLQNLKEIKEEPETVSRQWLEILLQALTPWGLMGVWVRGSCECATRSRSFHLNDYSRRKW